MQLTDDELLEGLRKGETKAMQYAYSRFFPEVRRHIMINSGTEHDAEDVFQEALVLMYKKLVENTLVLSCAPGTYLYAVARNMWRTRMRTLGREVGTDDTLQMQADLDENVLQRIEEEERLRLFRKYFDQLSVNCKRILELFFAGKDMKEIARELETTDGYVRKRKFVCKNKLIEMIEADPVWRELRRKPTQPKGEL